MWCVMIDCYSNLNFQHNSFFLLIKCKFKCKSILEESSCKMQISTRSFNYMFHVETQQSKFFLYFLHTCHFFSTRKKLFLQSSFFVKCHNKRLKHTAGVSPECWIAPFSGFMHFFNEKSKKKSQAKIQFKMWNTFFFVLVN